jgi:hypothetical protein
MITSLPLFTKQPLGKVVCSKEIQNFFYIHY